MMKKLFSDDTGNLSLGRIMYALSFLTGVVLAFCHYDVAVVSIFAGGSILGKVCQKKYEK